MYSKVIEQELYGEKWNKVKSIFRKGGIIPRSPLNKAASAGAGAAVRSAKAISKSIGEKIGFRIPDSKTPKRLKYGEEHKLTNEQYDRTVEHHEKVNGKSQYFRVLYPTKESAKSASKKVYERSFNNYSDDKSRNKALVSELRKNRSENHKKIKSVREKLHKEMKEQGIDLKDYPHNPHSVDDLKKIRKIFDHNQKVIDDHFRKKARLQASQIRRGGLKSNFKMDEHLRTRKFRVAGGVAGAGVGGTLGYALSKRATKNTEPSKKRTAIRIGSTVAGAALGGYAGQYAGKKFATRGVKARYREYLKNK